MPAPMLSCSPAFPALYLYPLNDSFFIPKQISLSTAGRRIQLGRKTSKSPLLDKKHVYFDSSVVSRRHAEVWQEGNKIFIRDTQSANGTFLKTNDILEFGTDVSGYYDTIAHHRIVCRIVCVFTQVEVAMVAMADSRRHVGDIASREASTSPDSEGSRKITRGYSGAR
ncbi:hypothetical protein B0H17DRAFT_1208926 [Mycena rosella]|uniref:FHA domain-containing protein n=1 Tax=Mycena rosella TaxID=1033263 RepID=A0AAD7D3I1_MYCRO|nr:hypothetical protein B0H17DRAFT_1208926 [Mycena rosella]